MASMLDTAKGFFTACETGKGWADCKTYCTPDASFSAQAAPLADVKTVEGYADWMKGMFTPFPDARYEIKSFAADPERNNVTAYAVFFASHTGPGGPVAPSGKSMQTDYVYVMQFKGDKINHMTKIWNDGVALKQVGWA
jgi:predicted ester cyclase